MGRVWYYLSENDKMKRLIELNNEEARAHFMKGSSYFNGDLPRYISFEPILADVASVLNGGGLFEIPGNEARSYAKCQLQLHRE